MTKPITKKKKCKKAKCQNSLQIAEERREVKSKGERQRYTQLNAEFQRTARRDKKDFLNEQNTKKQRKTIEQEKLELSSRKSEVSKEHFTQGWT